MVIEKVRNAKQVIKGKLKSVLVHAKKLSWKNFTKEGRFIKNRIKEINQELDRHDKENKEELRIAKRNVLIHTREKIKFFTEKSKLEMKKRKETLR